MTGSLKILHNITLSLKRPDVISQKQNNYFKTWSKPELSIYNIKQKVKVEHVMSWFAPRTSHAPPEFCTKYGAVFVFTGACTGSAVRVTAEWRRPPVEQHPSCRTGSSISSQSRAEALLAIPASAHVITAKPLERSRVHQKVARTEHSWHHHCACLLCKTHWNHRGLWVDVIWSVFTLWICRGYLFWG